MSPRRGPRLFLILTLTFSLFLAAAPAASALEIAIDPWSGPSMPEGAPATTNVTVTYECGDAMPAPTGGTITVAADLAEGANGTLTFDGEDIEPEIPIPEAGCTPGDSVDTVFELGYTASRDQRAGDEVEINVTAKAEGEAAPDDAEEITTATVGPFVDITFEALADTYEVVGGDVVTVEIDYISDSNVEVTATPGVSVPEGWGEPDMAPTALDTYLNGGPGNTTIMFDVAVPEAAEGEYNVLFSATGQSTDETAAETETVEIPLTFDVTSLAAVQNENEEGPAPAVFGVLLGVVALLAYNRRRQR